MPELLAAADILVHPAQFEGMPLIVLESMAAGLPVLASSVSGIPEALADSGVLLHDSVDAEVFPEQLARVIGDLASRPDMRQVMSQRGRLRARSCFTEARMLSEYLALIEQLLGVSQC
jgi:glycosyltransferase involved in cell wall biosynthesis